MNLRAQRNLRNEILKLAERFEERANKDEEAFFKKCSPEERQSETTRCAVAIMNRRRAAKLRDIAEGMPI